MSIHLNRITETLEKQGAFFDVVKKPVHIDGRVFEGKVGLVRADTGRPLGIVSEKYNLVTMRETWDRFSAGLQSSGLDLEGAVASTSFAKGGARTMLTLDFPRHVIEPKVGDVTRLRMLIKNSYDGRWKYSAQGAAMRLKCKNGMTLADAIGAYQEYHNSKLDPAVAAKQMVSIMAEFEKTKEHWLKLMSIPLKDQQAFHVFCLYANRPDLAKRGLAAAKDEDSRTNVARKLFEQYEVREKVELGANAYAALNTMTHHATHANLREDKGAIGLDLRRQRVEAVLQSEYWTKRIVAGEKH